MVGSRWGLGLSDKLISHSLRGALEVSSVQQVLPGRLRFVIRNIRLFLVYHGFAELLGGVHDAGLRGPLLVQLLVLT